MNHFIITVPWQQCAVQRGFCIKNCNPIKAHLLKTAFLLTTKTGLHLQGFISSKISSNQSLVEIHVK